MAANLESFIKWAILLAAISLNYACAPQSGTTSANAVSAPSSRCLPQPTVQQNFPYLSNFTILDTTVGFGISALGGSWGEGDSTYFGLLLQNTPANFMIRNGLGSTIDSVWIFNPNSKYYCINVIQANATGQVAANEVGTYTFDGTHLILTTIYYFENYRSSANDAIQDKSSTQSYTRTYSISQIYAQQQVEGAAQLDFNIGLDLHGPYLPYDLNSNSLRNAANTDYVLQKIK